MADWYIVNIVPADALRKENVTVNMTSADIIY